MEVVGHSETFLDVRLTPEERLSLAILVQAVEDLRILRATRPDSGAARLRTRDAYVGRHGTELWLASTDRTWPYSFERVCETLGLDARVIRVRLQVASRPPMRMRRWSARPGSRQTAGYIRQKRLAVGL